MVVGKVELETVTWWCYMWGCGDEGRGRCLGESLIECTVKLQV